MGKSTPDGSHKKLNSRCCENNYNQSSHLAHPTHAEGGYVSKNNRFALLQSLEQFSLLELKNKGNGSNNSSINAVDATTIATNKQSLQTTTDRTLRNAPSSKTTHAFKEERLKEHEKIIVNVKKQMNLLKAEIEGSLIEGRARQKS